MERAPLPSSPAANPNATGDRTMSDTAHTKRPPEGAPPTHVPRAHEPTACAAPGQLHNGQ
eukprot:scaffold67204_cov30-Tisochrysis_lutea.AAC.1